MRRAIDFTHQLAAAGFAGGCLLLSVMLSALFGLAPERGAAVMHTLLPRMGSVMAPLLVLSASSAILLAVQARRSEQASSRWLIAAAFAGVVLVTVFVHLPLNARFLTDVEWPAAQASALLDRWLCWHHVRTALALAALALVLWQPERQRRSAHA